MRSSIPDTRNATQPSIALRAVICLLLLPLIYLSVVRFVGQLVVPHDEGSLFETGVSPIDHTRPSTLAVLAALDPLDPHYPYLAARDSMTVNHVAAEKAIRTAIRLSPLGPQYWILDGWIRGAQGRFADGFQSFEKAIFLDPRSADAYAQQGTYIFETLPYADVKTRPLYRALAEQNLSLAERFTPALARNPHFAFALASIYKDNGDDVRARAALKRADDADTTDLAFLVRKWALHFQLGDAKKPITQWGLLFYGGKLSPDQLTTLTGEMTKQSVPDFMYFAAQIHLRKGDAERARLELTSLTSQRPNVAAYRLALGDVYEKLDRPKDALVQYEKAVELSPTDQYAKTKMIQYYRKR